MLSTINTGNVKSCSVTSAFTTYSIANGILELKVWSIANSISEKLGNSKL